MVNDEFNDYHKNLNIKNELILNIKCEEHIKKNNNGFCYTC